MTRRVLVADDSSVVRVSLVRRFKAAGLDVIEADSVAAALRLDPAGIDLAVLDYDLGDGYGDAIAEHLRAARPELPIAFFTSSSAEEKLDAYGPVFTKPDESDDVIAWVLEISRL